MSKCCSIVEIRGNCQCYGFESTSFSINSTVASSTTVIWSADGIPGLNIGTVIINAVLIEANVNMNLIINGQTQIALTQGQTYSESVKSLSSVEIETNGAVGLNQVTASISVSKYLY
ncbi:MAG: hypothetical protein CVV02_00075 [Firmicutes bacterium HGW-Firmicutes-7]|nr:MAG: hypothetical protein CVV02_00075 [Firmicutes bacterium HGW-Firmicutes-7]